MLDQEEKEDMLGTPELSATPEEHRAATLTLKQRLKCRALRSSIRLNSTDPKKEKHERHRRMIPALQNKRMARSAPMWVMDQVQALSKSEA